MQKMFAPVLALALGLTFDASRATADTAPANPQVVQGRTARWALTTSRDHNTASVYAIAPGTGALTLHATVATEAEPISIAAHPSGRFAYVVADGTGRVQTFRFDSRTGRLQAGPSVDVPGDGALPYAIAVEPLGRFAYVTCLGSSTIAGFWINPLSGALLPLGAPISTAAAPHEIVFDRLGRHAFVTNFAAGTISAYRIGLTGRLTPVEGSPFPTLARPEGLAIDPRGRFLYTAHSEGGRVSAFRVGARGTLTPVAGSPFAVGIDPFGVATSADGKTLYVSEPLIEAVFLRRIDTGTGALTDLPPSRVAAGNNVRFVRPDPSGRFLYVGGSFPAAIYAYALDAAGVPTPVAGSPFTAEGLSGLTLLR